MPRKVNFEGKQKLVSRLPSGSLFIEGMWYSSASKLPARMKKTHGHLFRKIKDFHGGACVIKADGTLIPVNVPADNSDVDELLSKIRDIEKLQWQIASLSERVLDYDAGNDKSKMLSYFREQVEFFGLSGYFDLSVATPSELVGLSRKVTIERDRLYAVLAANTRATEEGKDSLTLHFKQPTCPDGTFVPQENYAALCVEKKEASTVEELIGAIRDDREDSNSRRRRTWLWLTPEGLRLYKDRKGRLLEEGEHSNSSPRYFIPKSDAPASQKQSKVERLHNQEREDDSFATQKVEPYRCETCERTVTFRPCVACAARKLKSNK